MNARGLAIAIALTAIPGAVALAAVGSEPVTVHPAAGLPHTRFTVTFRAPGRSGSPSSVSRYQVSVSGAAGRACVSTETVTAPPAQAGATVKVLIPPRAPTRRWCTSKFDGKVQETARPQCQPRQACPNYIAIAPVEHFTFRVR